MKTSYDNSAELEMLIQVWMTMNFILAKGLGKGNSVSASDVNTYSQQIYQPENSSNKQTNQPTN